MKKTFAVVGSWSEKPGAQMGLTVFEARDEQSIKMNNYFPEIKVGSCIYDDTKSILYFVDEIQHPETRRIGGGGYVYAAYFDTETGEITMLNRKPSLGVKPDYCCFDNERKHLIAVHHGSTRDTVTQLCRDEKGNIQNRVVYDDIPTVLFRLNEDGSIGEACDYYLHEGINPAHDNPAHIHSVYKSPAGSFFAASDKGMDRIYSFGINGDRLEVINMIEVEHESDPRYGIFHPELNLFYGTNEKRPYVSIYRYSEEKGIEEKINEVLLLDGTEDRSRKITASDILIHGNNMYIALRRVNRLVRLSVSENGSLKLEQSLDIGGDNTRGLVISPDGRKLYCCNCESDAITVFELNEKGSIVKQTDSLVISCPGNMMFI